MAFNAGAIEATLTLDRSPFSRELTAARAQIKRIEDRGINIAVKIANEQRITALKNQVRSIKDREVKVAAKVTVVDEKKITALSKRIRGIQGGNVRLNVDTTTASTKIDRLLAKCRRIEERGIKVKLDIGGANERLDVLAKRIQALRPTMALDVDTAVATALVQQFRTRTRANAANMNVKADTTPATREVLGWRARMAALGVAMRLRVDSSSSQRALDGTRLLIMGIVGILPLITSGAAVAAANLVALGTALGGALGAAGVGGLAIFASVQAMNNLSKQIASAKTELAGLEEGTAEYAAVQQHLTNLQQRMQDTYGPIISAQRQLNGAWEGFTGIVKQNGVGVASQGIMVLSLLLERLGPVANAALGVMSQALQGIAAFITGPEGQRMLTFFEEFGSRALGSILTVLGNFTLFLGRLGEAFAPFAERMLGRLADITAGWAAFADGLGNNAKFQQFIAYVENVGPRINAMLGALISAVINIGVALAPIAGPMADLFRKIFDSIANANPTVLGAIVVGLGLFTAGLLAATAAQAALNVVMRANPIGLVITAIGALVGVLVYLSHENETARRIVEAGWRGIQAVVAAAIFIIEGYWKNIFLPVLRGIATTSTWLWKNVLSPVFGWIGAGFRGLVDGVKWVFENLLRPTWQAVAAVATWLWNERLKPAFDNVAAGWNLLVGTIKIAWEQYWRPVLELVGAVALALWNKLRDYWKFTRDAWTLLASVVAAVWRDRIKPIFDVFATVIAALWNRHVSPHLRNIRRGWDVLSTVISTVWREKIRPILDTFANFIGGSVRDRFDRGVSAIGTAWDRLKSLAMTPVRFVIDTVINKGIIDNFNKLADFFGTSKMARLPVPGAQAAAPRQRRGTAGSNNRGTKYATGGMMPGYTPGRDVHEFYSPTAGRLSLSGGEPVLRPEVGVVLGKGWVDSVNAAARGGGISAVQNFLGNQQALAGGGFIRPVGGPMTSDYGPRWGKIHKGRDYGVPTGTPVRAAASGRAKTVAFQSSWGNRIMLGHAGGLDTQYAHLSKYRIGVGDMVRQGQVIGLSGNTGNSTGPHLHFEVWRRGTRVPPGGYLTGGDAGAGAGGAAGGLGGRVMSAIVSRLVGEPAKFLTEKVQALFDSGKKSPFVSMLAGMPKRLIEGAVKKITGIAGADMAGGAYPGGGNGGSGVARWRDEVQQALRIKGLPMNLTDTVLRRMNQESSGNPRAQNGWDSNARKGTPSKGLMQVIDPTFRGYAQPGYNRNIWDPVSNILAGINWSISRWGSVSKGFNRKGGYALGGMLPKVLGAKVYDRGGMLPPGGVGVNLSNKPEPVFTGRQHAEREQEVSDLKQMVRDLVESGSGARALVGGDLILQARENASVRDQFDDIMFELRRQSNGG